MQTDRAPAPRPHRHPAYAAPSSTPPFALPPPDPAPLTGPTRTALLWEGPAWFEIEPSTGRVLASGSSEP